MQDIRLNGQIGMNEGARQRGIGVNAANLGCGNDHELGPLLVEKFTRRGVVLEIQLFVHVHIGTPAAEILRVAADSSADLVIVGSHDRGAVGRFLLGSVSQVVLRDARCPVLVARPKAYPPVELQRIVEVTTHAPTRELPHRYSYASSALLRPAEWPLP